MWKQGRGSKNVKVNTIVQPDKHRIFNFQIILRFISRFLFDKSATKPKDSKMINRGNEKSS